MLKSARSALQSDRHSAYRVTLHSSTRALGAGKSAAVLRSGCGGAAGGGDVDERAVLDRHGRRVHALGPAALRFVHQRVGALNQLGRELSCHATAFRDGSQPQADDADVDADGIVSQAVVLAAPVVAQRPTA